MEANRKISNLRFDAHLMVENPDRHIKSFAYSADTIIIHPETCKHLHRTLGKITDFGKKAGVALNPATDPYIVEYCADLVSVVVVMSVNPGASGQKFINSQLKKIAYLRKMLPASTEICVDGGINKETIQKCVEKGANSVVSGAYIFKSESYAVAIGNLKAAATIISAD